MSCSKFPSTDQLATIQRTLKVSAIKVHPPPPQLLVQQLLMATNIKSRRLEMSCKRLTQWWTVNIFCDVRRSGRQMPSKLWQLLIKKNSSWNKDYQILVKDETSNSSIRKRGESHFLNKSDHKKLALFCSNSSWMAQSCNKRKERNVMNNAASLLVVKQRWLWSKAYHETTHCHKKTRCCCYNTARRRTVTEACCSISQVFLVLFQSWTKRLHLRLKSLRNITVA